MPRPFRAIPVAVALAVLVVACSRRSADATVRGAVVACRASIDRYRAAAARGATPEALRGIAIDVRHDCARTVRDDACRRALTDEYEDYEAAMGRVARACRDAYCSRLRGPGTELCGTSGEPPRDQATNAATVQLLVAISAYEIDRPIAELVDLSVAPLSLEPPRMSRTPDSRSFVLQVACPAAGPCNASLIGPQCVALGHWPLDSGALGDSVRDAGLVGVQVAAAPDVPYQTLFDVLDVLRHEGVRDVSVGPPPTSCCFFTPQGCGDGG